MDTADNMDTMDTMDTMEERAYLTAAQAQGELGVSKVKMAELLRTGVLPHAVNPLNRRMKLIPAVAVEELKRRWRGVMVDPKARRVA